MLIAILIGLLVALFVALARALLGPTIFDRILAINTFGTKIVLLIPVYGFVTGRPEFIDIALAYSLINFIGTIAILKYFEYSYLGGDEYQHGIKADIRGDIHIDLQSSKKTTNK